MSNKIAIESSKLILNQFKTRHDWAGKVIHSNQAKYCILTILLYGIYKKLESVTENETHKILWILRHLTLTR